MQGTGHMVMLQVQDHRFPELSVNASGTKQEEKL
jgi:hypothetical protein